MRITAFPKIALVVLLMALCLVCATSEDDEEAHAKATVSPTCTSTMSPTLTTTATATLGLEGCRPDRDAIQAALHAYYYEFGEWPTASGESGDIKWSKLVPDFLPYTPHTDSQCDWQVNSDPEGEVCLWEIC